MDDTTRAALAANRVKHLQRELDTALTMGDESYYVSVWRELQTIAPTEVVEAIEIDQAEKVAAVLAAEEAAFDEGSKP
jgi:hypothetical protein